jgi:hypothetical protein
MNGCPSLPVRATTWRVCCLLGAAMLFTGCAGTRTASSPPAPAYVAPTQGARATLLLRVVQPGGSYSVSIFEQPVSCSHRRAIASGTEKAPERITTQLAAGKLQTLDFLMVREDRQACEIAVSFEPVRGRTYLLRNSVEGTTCRMELIDATSTERPAPVAHVRRELHGYGRLDDACKPLTAAVPSAPAPAAAAAGPSLDDFRQLLPRP